MILPHTQSKEQSRIQPRNFLARPSAQTILRYISINNYKYIVGTLFCQVDKYWQKSYQKLKVSSNTRNYCAKKNSRRNRRSKAGFQQAIQKTENKLEY